MHGSGPSLDKNTAEKLFGEKFPDVGSQFESLDPSEHIEFSRPSNLGVHRFDLRSDELLKEAAFDHSSSLERERAAWEYIDRHKKDALPLLSTLARKDNDPSVRWSSLWAIQKFGGGQSLDIIKESLKDEHPEVRDWAKLLIREITREKAQIKESKELKFDETNRFDQTLPLMIAGYARVAVPQIGWYQATLSPQWFESIMGRVMACTCQDTFENDLVVEKCIADYYGEGQNHYEIFKFKGFSSALSPDVLLHTYESKAQHPFYLSGKVGDVSKGVLDDVHVILNRAAASEAQLISSLPDGSSRRVVTSVRGRYMGMAYVNLERVLENKMNIGPGEAQLSTVHHPVVGALTNTFLFGSFKGKLSDSDGDGLLDVNTIHSPGTLDGELKSESF